MFSFSWSEIALIVGVALIAIGPKDLPVALKALSKTLKKARGMAAEFQSHVNEMMGDADLAEVKKQIDEIRHFDFKGEVERAVDPDRSIRNTFGEDPFTGADATAHAEPSAEPPGETAVLDRSSLGPALAEPAAAFYDAPSFVPPAVATAVLAPPSFVPPDLLSSRS